MSYEIVGDFLSEAKSYFEALPDIAAQSARMALNQVAERDGLAMLRKSIESQVEFPKGYLKLEDRLGVKQKATDNNLQVIISGRDRATSLARFAVGQTPESNRGKPVYVKVKRAGATRKLTSAFLVRLNNGNVGLATRNKALIDKAYKPVLLDDGVYLLYAPSVDQVFRTVAEDALPPIGELVTKEFFRQFVRLSTK